VAFRAQIVAQRGAPRAQLGETGRHPLAVREDGEVRPLRLRARLRGGDRGQLDVHAAELEDALGEGKPGALAAAGDVVESVCDAVSTLRFEQRDDGVGQVRRRGRGHHLIVDHPHRAGLAETDHRLDEVAALAAGARHSVEPGGADDEVARTEGANQVLARQFRGAVDTDRVGQVFFPVRNAAAAVEDVVGAEMDQREIELLGQACQVVGAGGVDRERGGRLVLADVHLVVRARIHDGVGPQRGENPAGTFQITDVQLGVGETGDLEALQRRLQVRPELPLGANDHDMSHDRDD
jgi:hypothetical protein